MNTIEQNTRILLIFSAKLFYKLFLRNLKIIHGIRTLKLISERGVNCENRFIDCFTKSYSQKWWDQALLKEI
jgi:hypothetical protein